MPPATLAWMMLLAAGLMEVGWVYLMKLTEGFTRLWPSVAFFAVSFASFYLLSAAVKVLPIGTAYAVWTGIGAVGAALLGILLYHEPAHAPRLIAIGMIVAGIVLLKATSP
ncbi:MAG: multidrug efflux SMR transporter [Sphingomonadales bacterium]|nr:MAG: multidrug efflux SMR transporter [Sphingomonadales bacterium]